MTEEQIQKLSEDKAIEAGYIQSDKEYFETTHWTQHNIYKEGVVEGYKTAMLQGDVSECENKYKQLEQHFKVLEYSYNACFEELTKLKTKVEPDISEDVEDAANSYSIKEHGIGNDKQYERGYCYNGFIAGAEWQRQRPVPTVDEDKDEDEFWNKVGAILNSSVSFSMYPKYLATLKQQFSITRK